MRNGALAAVLSAFLLAGCFGSKPTPPSTAGSAAPKTEDTSGQWWLQPQAKPGAAPGGTASPVPAAPAAAPAPAAPAPEITPAAPAAGSMTGTPPSIVAGSYPATFQAEDQKGFVQFTQSGGVTRTIEGLWSTDKSQCHKGIALDHIKGYGAFTVDTTPRGLGVFEERVDEIHSIYLHRDWIGRYYLGRNTLVLLSAANNRIQRTSFRVVSYGSDFIGYDRKEAWTYDLWEGTLLSASSTGSGTLVRCEPAEINAAYLASDPDLAKQVQTYRTEAKAREAEEAKRDVDAAKIFQEQKRFDAWVTQKKTEYKAEFADSLLRQTPLLADQRYWIIGSSVAVGTVRLGAVQTIYARVRYQANDQECLRNSVCPEYLLVMREADAGRLLKQNAEIRALVAKFVGVVNSAAGSPAPIFEPVELYPGK